MTTVNLKHVVGTTQVVVSDPTDRECESYILPTGFRIASDVLGCDIVDADGVTAGVSADHLGRISIGTMDSSGNPVRIELQRA